MTLVSVQSSSIRRFRSVQFCDSVQANDSIQVDDSQRCARPNEGTQRQGLAALLASRVSRNGPILAPWNHSPKGSPHFWGEAK